jgi:hypothetical protein
MCTIAAAVPLGMANMRRRGGVPGRRAMAAPALASPAACGGIGNASSVYPFRGRP